VSEKIANNREISQGATGKCVVLLKMHAYTAPQPEAGPKYS